MPNVGMAQEYKMGLALWSPLCPGQLDQHTWVEGADGLQPRATSLRGWFVSSNLATY